MEYQFKYSYFTEYWLRVELDVYAMECAAFDDVEFLHTIERLNRGSELSD
jgi:hypothetical protein